MNIINFVKSKTKHSKTKHQCGHIHSDREYSYRSGCDENGEHWVCQIGEVQKDGEVKLIGTLGDFETKAEAVAAAQGFIEALTHFGGNNNGH